MAHPMADIDLGQLTVPQRLELIERLWDSIPNTHDAFAPPEWHRTEVEQRLIAADAGSPMSIPWETVRAQLRKTS